MGFCWGGAMTNRVMASGAGAAAGVPYYGSVLPADQVPKISGPLLLQYAGDDARINAGIPDFEAALKANNKTYEKFVYEGAQHAFNNDSNPQRYNKAAAELAWGRTDRVFQEVPEIGSLRSVLVNTLLPQRAVVMEAGDFLPAEGEAGERTLTRRGRQAGRLGLRHARNKGRAGLCQPAPELSTFSILNSPFSIPHSQFREAFSAGAGFCGFFTYFSSHAAHRAHRSSSVSFAAGPWSSSG